MQSLMRKSSAGNENSFWNDEFLCSAHHFETCTYSSLLQQNFCRKRKWWGEKRATSSKQKNIHNSQKQRGHTLVPTSPSIHSMYSGRPFVSHVLIKFTQMCSCDKEWSSKKIDVLIKFTQMCTVVCFHPRTLLLENEIYKSANALGPCFRKFSNAQAFLLQKMDHYNQRLQHPGLRADPQWHWNQIFLPYTKRDSVLLKIVVIVLNLGCRSHYLIVVLWILSHQLGAHV